MVTHVGLGSLYLLSKVHLEAYKKLLFELDLIRSLCLVGLFKWKSLVTGSSIDNLIDFSLEYFHIESLVDYTF